jgi:hypothetical protein
VSYREQFEQAQKEGRTLNLDPTFVKLEKQGDTLIGRLLRRETVKAKAGGGTFDTYIFETDEGLRKTKFGAATDKQIGKSMADGAVYRIEFLGQEKLPEGTKVNRFKIEEYVDAPTVKV